MAADALAAAGARVHLAHPLGVKAFEYRRVRNDERDAGDLADLLRMGRLPEAWIAPPPTRELRELVRHRAKLVATRSGCKVQVHAVLAKCGIQVAVSDLFGGQGSRVLDELVLPGVFPARVASYRRVIEALDFEIGVFEHLLGGRLRDDRGYQAVQTIPGIGPVLGAVFVAEIGQVSRFARPRAAGVLGGVDTQAPRVRHQGPPRTDHQAGLAAGALGHGGVRAAGGQRPPRGGGAYRDRVGQHRGHNIGVVAAARKQIGHVYYALRDGHVRALDTPAVSAGVAPPPTTSAGRGSCRP